MFDPFGDFEHAGYLRNNAGLRDPEQVKRLEHASFLANLADAVEALRTQPDISYQSFLDTHQILFGDFYPWAGQDRAALTPNILVRKGEVYFAHGDDIRRAIDYGLRLAAGAGIRTNPGAVMGYFAHAHPFLDGNGRTLMLVFGELCFRAGFSIAWERTEKAEYLIGLTAELDSPEKGILDRYLGAYLAPQIPHERYSQALEDLPGLDGLERFLTQNLEADGYTAGTEVERAYTAAMKHRHEAYQRAGHSGSDDH